MYKVRLLALLSVAIALGGCSKKVVTTAGPARSKVRRDDEGRHAVGRSTRLNDDKVIGEEKYVIEGVTETRRRYLLFRSRLQHDGTDIPLPDPVTIKWPATPPVITLTDLSIRGWDVHGARPSVPRPVRRTWSGKKGGGPDLRKIVRNR